MTTSRKRRDALLELQWFQIALKTYFWAGVLFALVFATSLGCLMATKYYHDQAVLQRDAFSRDFQAAATDFRDARESVRKAGDAARKAWEFLDAVDKISKEIESKFKVVDGE